jgi:hypothetical protein
MLQTIPLIRNDSHLPPASPRDMIRNMVSKPTGKDAHRPEVPLRERPDRYLLTFLFAQRFRVSAGVLSERQTSIALACVAYGFPVSPAFAEKHKDKIRPSRRKRPPDWLVFGTTHYRGNADGGAARDDSPLVAKADDLTRTLRRFLKKHKDLTDGSEDSRWFLAMTNAWLITLDGLGDSVSEAAAHFTESVGESEYFERSMAPIVLGRFTAELGWEPIVPDFCPHAAAE